MTHRNDANALVVQAIINEFHLLDDAGILYLEDMFSTPLEEQSHAEIIESRDEVLTLSYKLFLPEGVMLFNEFMMKDENIFEHPDVEMFSNSSNLPFYNIDESEDAELYRKKLNLIWNYLELELPPSLFTLKNINQFIDIFYPHAVKHMEEYGDFDAEGTNNKLQFTLSSSYNFSDF